MEGVYTLKAKLAVFRLDNGARVVIESGRKAIVVSQNGYEDLVAAWKKQGGTGKLYLVGTFDTQLTLHPEIYWVPEAALRLAI